MNDLVKIVISMMIVSFILYMIWVQEKTPLASVVTDVPAMQQLCKDAFKEYGIRECDLA